MALYREMMARTRRALRYGVAVLLASLIFFSCRAAAVEVQGLYQVEVPVASQQADVRARAVRQGLERVIVRVAGSEQALQASPVRSALDSAQRYLQQFSYRTDETGQPPQQWLRLQYDATQVNALLRQAKQPVWGSNRPSLLAWVAVETSAGRQVIGAEQAGDWQQALLQAGQDSGLPVLLPMMDLRDENAVSVMDVWGLFKSRLESASRRYQPEVVLAGRVYQAGGNQWAGRWLLMAGDQTQAFSTPPVAAEKFASTALSRVAEILAGRYAVNTARDAHANLEIQVRGIDSVNDYAHVTSYLADFAMVESVAVAEIDGDRLTLRLKLAGDAAQFDSVLALDRYLVRVMQAAMPQQPQMADADLPGILPIQYEWRR